MNDDRVERHRHVIGEMAMDIMDMAADPEFTHHIEAAETAIVELAAYYRARGLEWTWVASSLAGSTAAVVAAMIEGAR